jgi:lipopolysaccharide transport system ATP-binding protein
MTVRLGFAVATALDPDVLILDEVLAVGDAAFRNKCYNRIAQLRKRAALILVSHNMEQVGRTCSTGLLMCKGSAGFQGDPENTIKAYESQMNSGADSDSGFEKFESPISKYSITINNPVLKFRESISIKIHIFTDEVIVNSLIKVVFYNSFGAWSAEAIIKMGNFGTSLLPGRNEILVTLDEIPLRTGVYKLGVILIGENGTFLGWSYKTKEVSIIESPAGTHSECILNGRIDNIINK